MEFKGTKGEWRVSNNDILKKYHTKIAKVHPVNENDQLEHKYNALLISKAPEMLEMLKEILAGRIRPREYSSEWDKVNELVISATSIT